ncbi:MAG: hypothetical protein C5B58_08015, partial [Acidobacteria bacterium]
MRGGSKEREDTPARLIFFKKNERILKTGETIMARMQEGLHWKALLAVFAVCLGTFSFSACTKKGFDERSLGPPEVLVTDVLERDIPIIREWIGSLDGSVDADVRARVSG